MTRIRQQLSLFVPEAQRAALEAVRAIVDPVQHQLIPAHVTLCREDELSEFSTLHDRLRSLQIPALQLTFAAPEVFSEHGIWMRCVAGLAEFHHLRKVTLRTNLVREQTPHITLAHPRNPKTAGNRLSNAAALKDGLSIRFTHLCHIEQTNDKPWCVLERFALTF